MTYRKTRISFSLTLFLIFVSANLQAEEPKAWVSKNIDGLVELYKQFHRSPEISFHEEKTGEKLAAEFHKLGIRVTSKVGGYGVIGLLKNGPGKMVMLRTDLDALPVTEKTGVPYASKVRTKDDDGVVIGAMHACGHDVHITNMIGVARYLAANKKKWSGTVMFLGQPAEERGAGATAMLKDGLFKRFGKPDFALALHVDAFLPTGYVGYRGGYAMANVDSVDITVKGKGGHGSLPQATIDPIAQAAQLIVDLQTIVSREISPFDPAVITVGAIHGGTKHNIISDSCHLKLTVRSYSAKVRKHLKAAIKRKAEAIAKSFRAPMPVVKFSEGTPSLFNNERLVERIVPVFEKVLGEDKVVPAEPVMGGEDFSQFGLAGVPIFMYRLGSVHQARFDEMAKRGVKPPSLHSPLYYPNAKEALEVGIVTMTSSVMELLKKKDR